VWEDWYTDRLLQYSPWDNKRRYVRGFKYNCMVVKMTVEESGGRLATVSDVRLNDEACSVIICPLCRVPATVLKMKVRGLCSLAWFDREYTYTVGREGRPTYIGYFTSIIYYDREELQWVWYDRKDNRSLATSSSPEESLLVGMHSVDFSRGLRFNKCAVEGPMVIPVMLTTCREGQFTCSDGQCIDIEQRCDQTSNCRDETDEDNCRMVIMKENYNKKIAPL
jgi:hypothetical protein